VKKAGVLLSCLLVLTLALTGCGGKDAGGADQILIKGSAALDPVLSRFAEDFMRDNQGINVTVSSDGGAAAGIQSIIDNTVDFAMVVGNVDEADKTRIKNYQEFLLGYQTLNIAISQDNPLAELKDSLTTEEVQKIFAGEIQYWDELDQSLPHNKILVVTSKTGDEAYQLFMKSIMGDKNICQDAIQVESMREQAAQIFENNDAIGYIGMGMPGPGLGRGFGPARDGERGGPRGGFRDRGRNWDWDRDNDENGPPAPPPVDQPQASQASASTDGNTSVTPGDRPAGDNEGRRRGPRGGFRGDNGDGPPRGFSRGGGFMGGMVMLKIDGVESSFDNIKNGSYKLQTPVLLIASGKLNKQEQAFIDSLLSGRGLMALGMAGIMPANFPDNFPGSGNPPGRGNFPAPAN